MRTIWKYILESRPADKVAVIMPSLSEPVRVAAQNGKICFWAIVNTDRNVKQVKRYFLYTGTGQPVPAGAQYIGSCSITALEWHVWEID